MIRPLAATALLLLAATSCGSDSNSREPVESSAGTASPDTVAVTTADTEAQATTTVEAPGLRLVGLGDSYPGALNCGGECTSYVELLGAAATSALGQDVTVTNLASNDSLTARELLRRVQEEDAYIDALRAADIVTIQVGNNDWQGPCSSNGHELCLDNGRASVGRQLADIIEVIHQLRGDQPTAIRVVTYPNASIGDPGISGPWAFDDTPEEMAVFQEWFAAALAAFDDTICEVAVENGAICVDVRDAFNGPSHDQDAGALLAAEHGHPSASGHQLIADTIAAMGFAPVG